MALIKGKQLGTGSNGVQTANLENLAVTTAKIDAAAITSAKLAAGAVDSAALASAAVTSEKIAAGAVDSAALASSAVTNAKIAAGAVDSTSIAASGVATANLQDSAVTTAKIADANVTSSKLAAGAVTSAAIAAGAINSSGMFASGVVDSAALASSSVTSAKISAGAVDTSALGALAVTTAKIAANAVTSSKVDSSVLIASGANPLIGNLSAGGNKFTNLGVPTSDGDAANKAYVDSIAVGLTDYKESVRVASTVNLAGTFNSNTLVASGNGSLTVDGVALAAGNRLLVKNQDAGAQNGIFTVISAGSAGSAWGITRSTDADTSAEVTSGMYTYVSEGTVNAGSAFVLATPDPIVLNTTSLLFVQFSGAGQIQAGEGLSKSGNTLSVNVDGTTIEISSDALRIAAGAAGAGLSGGGGSPLAVGAGAGISVAADSVAVLYGSGTDISAAAAGAAKAAGVLDSAARSDHAHSFPVAVAVNVSTSNGEGSSSSFARADHVHAAPGETGANKGMSASVTTADGQQACATGLASAPALASYAQALINGVQYTVGNGVKSKDSYFSGDSGTTARATNALQSGDKLFWNGSIAGFQLASDDTVDFNFLSF